MNEKIPSHKQQQELLPETKRAVEKAVAALVEAVPSESGEDGSFTMHDARGGFELPSGGKLIVESRVADIGLGRGIDNGMFVLGQEVKYENPDTIDGFKFSANHDLQTGELLMSFYEEGKVEARAEELLTDPDFAGQAELSSVVAPRYKVTPTNEIYEDGAESVSQTTIGGIGVGATFFYDSEEEAAESEVRVARYMAAYEKARKEFGSYELTEERAQRLLALIAEVRQRGA